jgi:hypothetical protein
MKFEITFIEHMHYSQLIFQSFLKIYFNLLNIINQMHKKKLHQ